MLLLPLAQKNRTSPIPIQGKLARLELGHGAPQIFHFLDVLLNCATKIGQMSHMLDTGFFVRILMWPRHLDSRKFGICQAMCPLGIQQCAQKQTSNLYSNLVQPSSCLVQMGGHQVLFERLLAKNLAKLNACLAQGRRHTLQLRCDNFALALPPNDLMWRWDICASANTSSR